MAVAIDRAILKELQEKNMKTHAMYDKPFEQADAEAEIENLKILKHYY